MTLGKKRNLMHEKSSGAILVYMDDDDYYPPTRISHAVEKLTKNPNADCAGSSEIYIYFKHIEKMTSLTILLVHLLLKEDYYIMKTHLC